VSANPPPVVVTVNGQVVAQAPDIETLAEDVTAGGISWNVLSGGEQIGLAPRPGATAVTSLLTPDDAAVLELAGNVGFGEVIAAGVRVNGRCWGWAQGATSDSWLLLPCDFDTQATELFDFSARQGLSMTGMIVRVTCRAMEGVAVATQWDDIQGVDWFEVDYGDDVRHLTERAARVAFDWETIDSVCPACVGEQGWVLSVEYDRASSQESVMRALDQHWRPCDTHLGAAGEGFDLIGHVIRWTNSCWEPVS
jgi:hypothetical protein